MLTWLFSSLCSLNCLEASAAAIRVGSDHGQLLTAVGWDGMGLGLGLGHILTSWAAVLGAGIDFKLTPKP